MRTSGRRPQVEIAKLRTLTTNELQALYRNLLGQDVRIRNRDYLFKRLAFRLQEIMRSEQGAQRKPSSTGE